ncbi:MAG: hypothetical protein LUI02_02330 [Clostridiales bacterium]|nr:hypothetical protein [Clostridiales bacterium]
MMKCRRTGLEVEVEKYELGQGMEDGFELWANLVTQGWIATDHLIKVTQDDGSIVCPYVKDHRGCRFIWDGDYVIIDEDGAKHVCGPDRIWDRYEKIED